MKIKYGIIAIAIILAGFFAFFQIQVVQAEDLTPTPEETPTETATPVPTDPTPIPSDTPTPEPTLTETQEPPIEPMAAFASPMLLAATPTKAVWFNSSAGVQSYDTIGDAIIDINSNLIPSDGLIHIENIYAGGETGTLSLYYDGTKPYTSTAIKGIIGAPLSPDNPIPTIEITQPLWIQAFTGGFTLSNLRFTGINGDGSLNTLAALVSLVDMSGTVKLSNLDIENQDSTGIGLLVAPVNGPVNLTNVEVDDNLGGGAYIQTDRTGSITVTNSSFDNNGGINLNSGLIIGGLVVETSQSNSAVSLNGVSASNNKSTTTSGLLIKKSGALTLKNSLFNFNLGGGVKNENTGLVPSIQGTVMLDNVTASDNYQSTPDIRGGSGIEINSNGAITANNIFTSGNLYYGMKLDNCNESASTCQSTLIASISVSNGEFSENYGNSGLNIFSRGAVTLTKLNAKNNPNGKGIVVDNSKGTAGVTLNGSMAGDNTLTGNGLITNGDITRGALDISSRGNIVINYVQSGNSGIGESNDFSGAYLDNASGTGSITVNNSSFTNDNGSGLILRTTGTATLKNVAAVDNAGSFGVDLDNYSFGNGKGNVAISGSSIGNNGSKGLKIETQGTVTISTTAAIENPDGGTYIHNYAVLPKVITISASSFNDNNAGLANGLEIISIGSITLTGVGASGNSLVGVLLDNPTSYGNVVVNNISNPKVFKFNGNTDNGLTINTRGVVSLTGVYADLSTSGSGAEINNSGGTGAVTITDSHFNENKIDGLVVVSHGAIKLTRVSASGNTTGFGASLHNESTPFSNPGLSILNDAKGIGSILNGFSGNGKNGLDLLVRGAVTLSNLEVNENTGNGMTLANNSGGPADVKITNSYFNGNLLDIDGKGSGFVITSMGIVTLNSGSASGNKLNGGAIDNQSFGVLPIKTVTISGFAFNINTGYGLDVKSNGVITLTSVKSNENGTYGIKLDNKLNSTNAGMIIKTSSANENKAGAGLEISTTGTVLLDGVSANGNNGGDGIKILGTATGTTTKSVTLNRVAANVNDGNGLEVDCEGLLTLNGISANGNSLAGTVLNNTSKSIKQGVSLLSSYGANNFSGNLSGDGLKITSWGAISISNVTANQNQGGRGVNVDNCTAPGCFAMNVVFNKVNTRGNTLEGVLVNTYGATITLTGVVSLSNNDSGIKVVSQNSLAKIFLLNGLFMGNDGHGIDVQRAGVLPPILTGSNYFGNGTPPNLYLHSYP